MGYLYRPKLKSGQEPARKLAGTFSGTSTAAKG